MDNAPLASVPRLRPLRLGELLDQAIRLYRQNFLTFIGIMAVIYIPLIVLQIGATIAITRPVLNSSPDELFQNSAYWLGLLSFFLILVFQYILAQGIAAGAVARVIGDNHIGKKTGILDAYRGIGRSWLTLLGALILILFLVILFIIWAAVPCIGWITGLGMLAFLMLAINPLVPPIIVLEGKGVFASIARAWKLARRRFWPVVGYVFILYLFSLIIVRGPVSIASLLLRGTSGIFHDPGTALIVTSIVQGVVSLTASLIYYPLQMTSSTLIYLDLRVRTEGLDLALSTMNASSPPTDDPISVFRTTAVNSPESLVTFQDWGNVAILTLISFASCFLLYVFAGVFGVLILYMAGMR